MFPSVHLDLFQKLDHIADDPHPLVLEFIHLFNVSSVDFSDVQDQWHKNERHAHANQPLRAEPYNEHSCSSTISQRQLKCGHDKDRFFLCKIKIIGYHISCLSQLFFRDRILSECKNFLEQNRNNSSSKLQDNFFELAVVVIIRDQINIYQDANYPNKEVRQ